MRNWFSPSRTYRTNVVHDRRGVYRTGARLPRKRAQSLLEKPSTGSTGICRPFRGGQLKARAMANQQPHLRPRPNTPSTAMESWSRRRQSSRSAARAFRLARYTPPSPCGGLEVYGLSQQSNVDCGQGVEVMRKDPMLRGASQDRAVGGLCARGDHHIAAGRVVRLGLRNLSEIRLEVSLARGSSARTLRRADGDGTPPQPACAYLARMVSGSPDRLGVCLSVRAAPRHRDGSSLFCSTSRSPQRGTGFLLLGPALQQCHQEASAVVAGLWKLPADVRLVLGHHNDVVIDDSSTPGRGGGAG